MVVVGVTGHRPDKLGGYSDSARIKLEKLAKGVLTELKPTKVITGMALGWDQAIATACVELNIPFIAAIPFRGQETKWPVESQERYHKLLSHAAEVVIVCEGSYAAYKMQLRNQWIVDRCELLVALWDGSGSGTKNCIDYAVAKGKPIRNVWEIFIHMCEVKDMPEQKEVKLTAYCSGRPLRPEDYVGKSPRVEEWRGESLSVLNNDTTVTVVTKKGSYVLKKHAANRYGGYAIVGERAYYLEFTPGKISAELRWRVGNYENAVRFINSL